MSIRPNASNTTGGPVSREQAQAAQAQAAQGGRGGRGGGGGRFGRWQWDSPVIVSPHSSRRLYFGGERLYRSDDRGDSWIAVSPDLTRQLDAAKLPIMGKVWPPDSVAFNQATSMLSVITTVDESPLLEGLLYVGTDDGNLQVSEDGGKNWRKVGALPGVPENTYVTDAFASPRDSNIAFVTVNNYQRGDFKPYVLKTTDRGRTWTSVSGDLPPRADVWSVAQDHVNPNLLFAGTEIGVFFTTDGGAHWVQLEGGIPTTQARDLVIQKREGDLVVASFGRGAYILDDYSALREVTPQALAEEAHLFPLRNAYQFNELGQLRASWGDPATPNPPYGAVFTFNVGQAPAGDAKLVLQIADDTGKQVRRIELPKDAGMHRIAWDLRGDPPAPPAGGRAGAPGGDPEAAQTFGRGRQGGPLATPGRYRATIGRLTADTFSAIGAAQSFAVVPLPR